jgi:hypothetical protein
MEGRRRDKPWRSAQLCHPSPNYDAPDNHGKTFPKIVRWMNETTKTR